jgi:hypothetical protein
VAVENSDVGELDALVLSCQWRLCLKCAINILWISRTVFWYSTKPAMNCGAGSDQSVRIFDDRARGRAADAERWLHGTVKIISLSLE